MSPPKTKKTRLQEIEELAEQITEYGRMIQPQ
jgi:hypothetical protein